MKKVEMLLIQTMEEAAEVVQETSKCLRFGPHEQYIESDKTNIERVRYEFNDLYAMMMMLQAQGLFEGKPIIDPSLYGAKGRKVNELLEYSRKCGTLE